MEKLVKIPSECRSSESKEHIKATKIADSVLLHMLMCSNVMVQHCQRLQRNSIFKLTQNEPNDPKWPENMIFTMMMYGETFYDHYMAQHQLQWK